jgi:nudix-type nucleoside diphosphatase (YffH/AdpP family)
MARLRHYGLAFGHSLQVVQAISDGRALAALSLMPGPSDDAAAPTRSQDGAGFDIEVAREVMAHFGRPDAVRLPMLMRGIRLRARSRARGPETRRPRDLSGGFGAGDATPPAPEPGFTGFFAIEKHRLSHRRFDGAMSPLLDREVFATGDAVTLLPWDPARDAVLLIEQFRCGPYARRDPCPWQLEAVAGLCDRAESPEAAARREAREEAGLDLGRVALLARYYTSPGAHTEFITSFVGEADLAGAGGVNGLAEEHEDIRSLVVPLDTALAAIDSGEISNAPLILSLMALARMRTALRAAWA